MHPRRLLHRNSVIGAVTNPNPQLQLCSKCPRPRDFVVVRRSRWRRADDVPSAVEVWALWIARRRLSQLPQRDRKPTLGRSRPPSRAPNSSLELEHAAREMRPFCKSRNSGTPRPPFECSPTRGTTSSKSAPSVTRCGQNIKRKSPKSP